MKIIKITIWLCTCVIATFRSSLGEFCNFWQNSALKKTIFVKFLNEPHLTIIDQSRTDNQG